MNARGRDIFDLSLIHDLQVCNVGNTPTFETITHGHARSSIIDITLVSSLIYEQVSDWKVCNVGKTPIFETMTHNHHNHHRHNTRFVHNLSPDHGLESVPGRMSVLTTQLNRLHIHSAALSNQFTHSSTYQHIHLPLQESQSELETLQGITILTRHSFNDTLDRDMPALYTDQLESLIDTITKSIHSACRPSMPIRSSSSSCKPPSTTRLSGKDSILTQFTSSDTSELDIQALDTGQLESLIDTIIECIHTACRDSTPVRSPGAKCKPPRTEALEARKREVIHTHRTLHAAKAANRLGTFAEQLLTLKKQYAAELKAEASAPRHPPVTLKVGGSYTTDLADTTRALLDNFYPDDSTLTDVRQELRAHMEDFPETLKPNRYTSPFTPTPYTSRKA
ncbi:hypothetical protein KGM_210575 [Danaus plexippus plexippus]|uniref:Uncharacterized protein n=1 Tax=Danaus plexippus plexippus TaxID=278856 RepID=A0A212EXH5_DANPL|nr:hypothetical protein KGM_210575 [Danaus plexippus plexippus]